MIVKTVNPVTGLIERVPAAQVRERPLSKRPSRRPIRRRQPTQEPLRPRPSPILQETPTAAVGTKLSEAERAEIARALSGGHIRYRDRAVIIAGGRTVWEDCRALLELVGGEWAATVIAVNDVACHYPARIDHWVSLHPNKLDGARRNPKTGMTWAERRRRNGYPDGYETWAHHSKMAEKHVKPWGQGASGLLAVAVAYHLGFRRIVLCGVPMEAVEHFAESTEHTATKKWVHVSSYRKAWEKHAERLRKRTRSMGGWTRGLLGVPTLEWLNGA